MTLLLFALACQQTGYLEGNFDGPVGVGVLHPDLGGPFYEPVAVVSNSRSGTLALLDVKHGALVADQGTAPFLSTGIVPTGRARILGDVVAWAPAVDRVQLYVADAFTRTLVELPWVVGVEDDGRLQVREPALVGEPELVDADSSGDTAAFARLELRSRYAAQEDWTFTFDGAVWQVEGSRTGALALPAQPMVPYEAEGEAFEALISGTATAGDQLRFSVDRGAVEHDLGGYIEALHALPAQGLLLASLSQPDEGLGGVVVFDLAAGAVVGSLPLPAGALPGRLSADPSGELLYIADRRAALAYEVLLDPADPAASAVRTLTMPAPLTDLAWQAGVGQDGAAFEHLFVAPLGQNRVDLYDLATDTWVDVNPWTPELDGVRLEAPVSGLGAAEHEVLTLQETEWGARVRASLVAIATSDGAMFLAHGDTGCLAWDLYGPYGRLADGQTPEPAPFEDEAPSSDAWIESGGSTARPVQVNPCGGLARNESWTASYVAAENSWVVRGSLSGEQQGRARTDQRYTTDGGEVSFLILSGAAPYTEGDRFNLIVSDGVARISGDTSGDGAISTGERSIEAPGRPVVTSYLAGPEGGGWDEVNRKVMAVWPITNSDNVLRVNLQSAQIDAAWD